ncbi:MAG: hypothetical protein GSR79_05110 [Desulfurococcales archaeon]|nr:hypothetical protein [Desulfurococcales archaeon]
MSEMKVGGSVSLGGPIEFENIDVGGSLKVKGDLTVRGEFKIGGSANIEGSLKTRSGKIGGTIVVQGKLYASRFTIGGSGEIGEGVIGELIVGGSLKAGKLYVKEARISGNYTGVVIGKTIILEKKTKIKGTVIAEKLVAQKNSEIEEAYVIEAELERGVEVNKLHCVRCILGKKSWIGLLRYKDSYKDEGSEIDKAEKTDIIPELEVLGELENKLEKYYDN